jgi:hypothetical protein
MLENTSKDCLSYVCRYSSLSPTEKLEGMVLWKNAWDMFIDKMLGCPGHNCPFPDHGPAGPMDTARSLFEFFLSMNQ